MYDGGNCIGKSWGMSATTTTINSSSSKDETLTGVIFQDHLPHRQIYQAALDLYHKDQPCDFMTVMTWLKDYRIFTKVGGEDKLTQLLDRTVSAVDIDRYAALVVDKY